MDYMKVKQAAEQWNLSDRRVRDLCEQGKIEGVIKKGRVYLIPTHAQRPEDGRRLRGKMMNKYYH